MENYTWIVALCFLIIWLIFMIWVLKSMAKIRWLVVLKNGTKFIGRRTLKTLSQESFLQTAYKVEDGLDSSFIKGTIIHLGWGAKLYSTKLLDKSR